MMPKLIVTVCEKEKRLNTISVLDVRTGFLWSKNQIIERGIAYFLNIKDLKETLNWNTNSNESLFESFISENSNLITVYLYD